VIDSWLCNHRRHQISHSDRKKWTTPIIQSIISGRRTSIYGCHRIVHGRILKWDGLQRERDCDELRWFSKIINISHPSLNSLTMQSTLSGCSQTSENLTIDCRPILLDCVYATAFVLLLRTTCHCLVALPIAALVDVYHPSTLKSNGGKHQSIIRIACIEYLTGRIATKSKTYKFLESAWKWAFYVSVWVYAYLYMLDEKKVRLFVG
jgi:hypothetical protein